MFAYMTQKIITYRGVRLNQRTINMIEAAEWIAGFKFRLTQGSYNAGGVAASAGTHDGGGAVDIALRDASTGVVFPKVRRELIRNATRQVGFASWIRDPSQSNWVWHCHCEAVGDPELSSGAKKQITAYMNNRNGLASNGPDDGPRTWVGVTWEQWEKAHPNWREPFTMGQYENLMQQIKDEGSATRQEVRRQAIWMLRYGVQTEDNIARANKIFDDAKEAGKTDSEAMQFASASLSDINADLTARALENG